MELPHRTTRNYKALLRTVGTDIFNATHKLEPYYAAAYAHYRLDFLFRNQTIPADLKAARYHLLMASRLIHSTAVLPPMNSNEMVRWCEGYCEALWDEAQSITLFERAAETVRVVAAGDLHRDNIRTEPFTEALKTKSETSDSTADGSVGLMSAGSRHFERFWRTGECRAVAAMLQDTALCRRMSWWRGTELNCRHHDFQS